MTELLQQLVDGLGQGSIYALLALGLALIFGVLHLVNFAHGELITVSAYLAYWLSSQGAGWEILAPAIVLTSIVVAVLIELLAFRWVRGSSEFTMLLTSFGVHFVVAALFVMYVSPRPRAFAKPSWIFSTIRLGGVSMEIVDLATIGATLVTLALTAWILRRTTFGVSLRAAAEDFGAASMMGVRGDRVIRGAFALSGLLAGVAGVFWLMRTGTAEPNAGLTPLLFGVIAAIVGGLGSLPGAVLGGLALGVTSALLRGFLPDEVAGLTEGFLFVLVALLFVVRPQGLITVRRAERV